MIHRISRTGVPWGATGLSLLAAVLITCAASADVQDEGSPLKIRRSRVTGRASFVTAEDGGAIAIRLPAGRSRPEPEDFLRQHGHLFGIADPIKQLVIEKRWSDAIGHTHATYQQVHHGVAVFSGVLKVHQDARGGVIAANGHFHSIKPSLNVIPVLGTDKAVSLAAAEIDVDRPTVERSELVIVDPGWYGDPPLGEHLAYHIVLTDPTATLREAFFVDAHTGAILDRWSMIYRAKSRSIHDAEGGSDCCYEHPTPGCDDAECEFNVCEKDTPCCDEEWDVSCTYWAAQLCGTSCLPGTFARGEGDPPTGVADVDAAFDYYGDTYDYYYRAFGRDGIDDLGLAMVATVNSPVPGCPNAYWSGERRQMVFCPGTVSDDIVAHELTHGVTEFTANLVYQNQPGQLNESFSDVFGELIDLFNGDSAFAGPPGGTPWPVHPTGPGLDTPNNPRTACSDPDGGYPDGVRWLIGEDAVVFGGAIRDMWDPTCLGDPDRANSPLQTCPIFDSGGVHSGSGIPNHAFAMLTDGATFNGYTITGIGPIKAGAVWYRALTTYLTVASDFRDAYDAFNQAALDLIGTFPNDPRSGAPSNDVFTAADAAEVDNTLRAVEMDTRGRCGWTVSVLRPDPPFQCADITMIYTDDFESGTNGWTVSTTGPSGPPTPYDWVQTVGALPFDRGGVVWYCENRDIGDCDSQDESARHSLLSLPINLPADADYPFLSFTHYMESEPAWDGGNISVRVNGGEWEVVPGPAFEFNPYNSVIRSTAAYGNTNPLAGLGGWTGVGGKWGTSVVALRAFAGGGDTVEVRFDFGKDGCGGFTGWYLDDFAVYACGDCNLNGIPDHQEFVLTAFSGPLGDIGKGSPQSFALGSRRRAAGDVTLTFTAIGDLNTPDEYINVRINGRSVGTVFTVGGSDCPSTPNSDTIVVPAQTFNDAILYRDLVVEMSATLDVNASLCNDETFIAVFVEYEQSPADENENGIPDECEGCATAEPPTAEPDGVSKNRYISLVPGNPGRQTALRVTLVDLPEPFAAFEGEKMWVGAPHWISELAAAPGYLVPVFNAANLTCEPIFRDWSTWDVLHVFDEEILPEAVYEVRAIDLACGASAEEFYSTPLSVATSRWGDVTGDCSVAPCTPPDGIVDFVDITAIVDKFANLPGAPIKARVDLAGNMPSTVIDFVDVSYAVDAFRGLDYPFPGPQGCP